MPAVRAFALYAAVSLTFNFILQITCFVAAMALDARFKFCALLAEQTHFFKSYQILLKKLYCVNYSKVIFLAKADILSFD